MKAIIEQEEWEEYQRLKRHPDEAVRIALKKLLDEDIAKMKHCVEVVRNNPYATPDMLNLIIHEMIEHRKNYDVKKP